MICDVTNDISWFHGCYVTERYLVTDSPDQSRAQVSKGCEVVRLGSGFVTAVPHTNQTNEIQPPLIRDYDGCIDLDQRGCITSHRINSVTKPPTQCLVRAKYPEIQVLRWWLAGVAIRAQIRGLEASHSPRDPFGTGGRVDCKVPCSYVTDLIFRYVNVYMSCHTFSSVL